MSIPCKVLIPGRVSWRKLLLESQPQVGDEIRLPENDSILRVSKVLHDAVEPDSADVPGVLYLCDWVVSDASRS